MAHYLAHITAFDGMFVALPITFGNQRVISYLFFIIYFFSDCVMDTNSATGVCVVIEQQKQQPSL